VVRDCLHIRRYPVVEVLGVAEEVRQWMYLSDYIAMNEDNKEVMTRYVAFLKDLKEDEMNEEAVTDSIINLMVMWIKDSENPLYNEETNRRMKAQIEGTLQSKITDSMLIYGYTLTEAREILSHQKEIRIEAVRRFVKRVRGQMSVGASFEDLDRALKGELALMEGE
jgi:hypothetical protein